MSSTTTTSSSRVDFVCKRTQGRIGDYVWDIVNGNSPKIFHQDELQNFSMTRQRKMALITLWTAKQLRNFDQLALLVQAASKGDKQGLSERAFKTHAHSLIRGLGPAFLVASLKCFKGEWGFQIACIFNQDQIEHTVETYDGVHKEKGYWYALSKQLQVIPPGGQTDANFWEFHQELVLPSTHIADLATGRPVHVAHKWVENVTQQEMTLTVNGGKSPDYHLKAAVSY